MTRSRLSKSTEARIWERFGDKGPASNYRVYVSMSTVHGGLVIIPAFRKQSQGSLEQVASSVGYFDVLWFKLKTLRHKGIFYGKR